jgi:threonine dehydratase
VLVSEREILAAQLWLWEEFRLAVEPAAATTIAAIRSGSYRPKSGERVVAVLSGGNFDAAMLA